MESTAKRVVEILNTMVLSEDTYNAIVSIDEEGESLYIAHLIVAYGDENTQREFGVLGCSLAVKPKPIESLNEAEKRRLLSAFIEGLPYGRDLLPEKFQDTGPEGLRWLVELDSGVDCPDCKELSEALLCQFEMIELAIKQGILHPPQATFAESLVSESETTPEPPTNYLM